MSRRYPDGVAPHPYLDARGPIAIAHRGGAGEAPENTREAFEAAHALGFRYFETDAQLSADGVVVAFHDDKLDRVSNEVGKIADWRWNELADVPINGTGRLSTMEDLLAQFPETRFNIDAKSDRVLGPLLDLISSAGAFDRICLGSFSERRLKQARARCGDELCTSFGPRAIIDLMARSRGIARPLGAGRAVQAPARFRGVKVIDERFVSQVHKDGLVVHAWTIDDPGQMHQLFDMGVDGIMTDRPSVLRRVMEDRDLW